MVKQGNMQKFVILNVLEDDEELQDYTKTVVGHVAVLTVTRSYAERSKSWACGIAIAQVNIFCELSPEATMYLLARCRPTAKRPAITYIPQGLFSISGLKYDAGDIREWLQEVYETYD